MLRKNIKEKRHRLPLHLYHGRARITFTLCIKDKEPLFKQKEVVWKFIEVLKEARDRFNCKNWVYTFMPDHLHLIIEGRDETSDLWEMIVLFKRKTGYWMSRNKTGTCWQKDFYDHIHRKEEDLKTHIIYILNNPVRKGLATDRQEYPFVGSLDFSLEEIVS